MDSGMKQRLIGAAVLVALAVIFLPMLVQGPAPDSGVSDVPLSMPDAPAGNYETRDLPLATPGTTPDGGAVGMQATPPAAGDGNTVPSVDSASAASASQAVAVADGGVPTTAPAPLPQPASNAPMLPPATAGGDYAVHFGSFATIAGADRMVASLRGTQLPAYREQGLVDGKPVWRVRIGPYASRADAEAARLRAADVRDDVGARVIALDAGPATPRAATPAPATPVTAPPSSLISAATSPAPASSKPAGTPKPAPIPSATVGTGFAVQLAAFSKPADAEALRDKLRAAGFTAFTESVDTDKGTLTRVRAGPVASQADAVALKARIKAKIGVDGIVRPYP